MNTLKRRIDIYILSIPELYLNDGSIAFSEKKSLGDLSLDGDCI